VKNSVVTVSTDLDIIGRATAAEKWLKSCRVVINKKQADTGALHATNLSQSITALQRAEKTDKLPIQLQLRAITEHYQKSIAPLIELRNIIRGRLLPYLEHAETQTNAPTTRIGSVGHAVVLRSWWQAEILDKAKALKAAADEPEVLEALQMVANRWARESKGLHPLPGTRATEIRKGV
jgi:hypothetical protein